MAVTVDPPAAGQRVALTLVNLNGADDDVPSIRLGPMVAAGAQPGTLRFALPAGAPPRGGVLPRAGRGR